ncbi:splicing endonuclease positive effector sen1, putative [Perkinsus marinus ATCC 50983]|uniref:Splicing endonuclease positive effector sen1, putative n=1 Tax=Perkinsus marinus (strain ATCC 50983 / TXsc) TaxID=423536 RepID=C5L0Y0_PERM5|nr:splicing endonuclease positive effector sen1, putative [Perkinsus marinus ATCC 50983]EER09622.1 splicing endonuclease positive effector sen1, putative [Perkinsus marinus ATCC 50983]|eukprot:XP_002777827.1 splicing endonuclease positive effector sen1, putative [Perkinsus marinus ATCC 50983]
MTAVVTTTAPRGPTAQAPSLTPLQQEILSWDFFKDVNDDRTQEELKKLHENEDELGFDHVPLRFENFEEYNDVFYPLFLRETKSQLDRARHMERGETEKFSHLTFRIINERIGFVRLELIRMSMASREQYGGSDLVLMSSLEDPLEDNPVHALAYVESFVDGRLSLRLRLDLQTGHTSDRHMLEFRERSKRIASAIAENADWYITKITSMSTIHREYQAMQALRRSPLLKWVLNDIEVEEGQCDVSPKAEQPSAKKRRKAAEVAKPATRKQRRLKMPPGLKTTIEGKYNDSQRHAIMEATKSEGLTLIQGPPGTGKTTTIVGILSAILNSDDAEEAEETDPSEASTALPREIIDDGGELSSSDIEDDAEFEKQLAKRRKRNLEEIRKVEMKWAYKGFKSWQETAPKRLYPPQPNNPKDAYPEDPVMRLFKENTSNAKPKRKVLVCAPSNAAIDEIVRRVTSTGIYGRDGTLYTPYVVRLGPNLHPSLQQYSLESIMATRRKATSGGAATNKEDTYRHRVSILNEAVIVCATLSVSGGRDLLSYPGSFDTVVVDEASQGVEMGTLIPLQMGCQRMVLVGDPKQLPATVFSATAERFGYGKSLFQRLQQSDFQVNLLSTQFRMHPAIAEFPSNEFYDGGVKNAENIMELVGDQPWSHIPIFGPVSFFNVPGQEEKSYTSLTNEAEANFIIHIFKMLQVCWPKEPWREKLAVISPYAEQVRLIRQKFRQLYNMVESKVCPVEVNTVDGFQGREKDCVVVSTVRADPDATSVGFVRDVRRMNVSLTRGRTNLWVCGHQRMLSNNPHWKSFIVKQQKAKRLFNVTPGNVDGFLRNWMWAYFVRNKKNGKVMKYRPEAAEFLADEHLKKGAAGSASAADILQKSEGGAFKLSASEITALYEKSAIAAKAKALEKDVGKDIEEVASLDSPLEGVSPAATSPAIDADMLAEGSDSKAHSKSNTVPDD